jgi:hypothetical protein
VSGGVKFPVNSLIFPVLGYQRIYQGYENERLNETKKTGNRIILKFFDIFPVLREFTAATI